MKNITCFKRWKHDLCESFPASFNVAASHKMGRENIKGSWNNPRMSKKTPGWSAHWWPGRVRKPCGGVLGRWSVAVEETTTAWQKFQCLLWFCFGYVSSINLVTVGKESIHLYEGNSTNLHYPLFFFQCLGRTQWICFFHEFAYLDHPIGCLYMFPISNHRGSIVRLSGFPQLKGSDRTEEFLVCSCGYCHNQFIWYCPLVVIIVCFFST